MIWPWGVIVYTLVALVAAKVTTGHLAWRACELKDKREPSGEDWFWYGCVGVCVGLIWPVALLWVRFPAPAVGAERRAVERQRKERLEELERRNLELEQREGL